MVKSLSEYFYQQREMIALLCFGNQQLEWLIKASKTPYHIDKILASIQAGGGTPLGDALFEIQAYLAKRKVSNAFEQQKIFLITDGRSRDNLNHLKLNHFVTTEIHVLDSETSAIKLGKAKQLADTLNANYVNLCELEQKNTAHNKT